MSTASSLVDTVDLKTEIRRTNPDFIVYAPKDRTGNNGSTGNEHFLVFDGPDGSLMAVWTASTREGTPDQHIAFARSTDEGVTWSEPTTLAGPPITEIGMIASWAFPLVSRSGRVYVIYNQGMGKDRSPTAHHGQSRGIYSDDAGKTWSAPADVPFPKSRYDSPDPNRLPTWVVWQRPDRLTSDGKYFVGMTTWVDKDVRKPSPIKSWTADESVVSFIRFDNIDDNPSPDRIKLSFFAHDDKALRVPFPNTIDHAVVQEPSIVKLPDDRFFCTLRTRTGNAWWTQSSDDGQTWSEPRILQQSDGGPAILQPLSCCPIYDLQGAGAGSGRYVFFHHNNNGHFGQWKPENTDRNRRPVYATRGRFVPGAKQPVWFDDHELMMDQGDIGLGPIQSPRYDLALYGSFTVRQGQPVFWYPERKTFLLGRKISPGPA